MLRNFENIAAYGTILNSILNNNLNTIKPHSK